MNISILGSGNVATLLSKAFIKVGHTIDAVYSRNIEHAQTLAEAIGCPRAINHTDLLPKSDIYLFALKDDSLASVIQQLSQNIHARKGTWIHTAGSVPLSVFPQSVQCGVLYPMMTLSKDKDIDFKTIPLFVEGNTPQSFKMLEDLANELSDTVYPLDSAKRKKLHLAAVFANNFTNHCCTLAYHLLEKNGIAPTVLLPIIDETAQKLHHLSPTEAQTGPAKRWDEKVMNEQLHELADEAELQEIYRLMSQSIHQHSHSEHD